MLRVIWLVLAVGNFVATTLDYLSNSWPLFFANAALGFLLLYDALESPAKRAEGHDDE